MTAFNDWLFASIKKVSNYNWRFPSVDHLSSQPFSEHCTYNKASCDKKMIWCLFSLLRKSIQQMMTLFSQNDQNLQTKFSRNLGLQLYQQMWHLWDFKADRTSIAYCHECFRVTNQCKTFFKPTSSPFPRPRGQDGHNINIDMQVPVFLI